MPGALVPAHACSLVGGSGSESFQGSRFVDSVFLWGSHLLLGLQSFPLSNVWLWISEKA